MPRPLPRTQGGRAERRRSGLAPAQRDARPRQGVRIVALAAGRPRASGGGGGRPRWAGQEKNQKLRPQEGGKYRRPLEVHQNICWRNMDLDFWGCPRGAGGLGGVFSLSYLIASGNPKKLPSSSQKKPKVIYLGTSRHVCFKTGRIWGEGLKFFEIFPTYESLGAGGTWTAFQEICRLL